MTDCINKCTPYEYENSLSPTPVESDLVQVYDSIEQITNPNSNHIYVVGNDIYVFDGTRFLHTKECNIPPYDGEYNVTAPSDGELTLQTKDKLMTDDVTIEANHTIEDALIQYNYDGVIEEYYNERITDIRDYAFIRTRIKKITLPNATWARRYSFGGENVSLLEELHLPSLDSLGNLPFQNNPNLRILDVRAFVTTSINGCTSLTTLILRKTSIFEPAGNFSGNPFAPNGTGGYVYVPQALLSQYQNSTAWQQYAHVLEFRPIEGSEYELEE